MNRLGPKGFVAFILVALVVAEASAAEHARREHASRGAEMQRLEQLIRAGRSVTKRVQRDPHASAEIKQKATELDQVLDTRERTIAKLDAQYRDFLSRHKAELDEIEELRRRAFAIDEPLGQARTALVQANQPEIDELRRSSQRARELVETLSDAYQLDRRTRRTQ